MRAAYTHWLPMYIFDEIAEAQSSQERRRLLDICRQLKGDCTWVLKTPGLLIQEAIAIYSTCGKVDWNGILKPQPNYEQAIASGIVFDDDLSRVQRPQIQGLLNQAEEFFQNSRGAYGHYFQSGPDRPTTIEDIVEKARSTHLVGRNVQHFFRVILQQEIELQRAECFARVFPPITSVIYSFLFAHYRRNDSKAEQKRKAAGAIDLLAAAYLPLCHKYVSDDRDQQRVFRDVVKHCALRAEVVWFSGDFRKRFAN